MKRGGGCKFARTNSQICEHGLNCNFGCTLFALVYNLVLSWIYILYIYMVYSVYATDKLLKALPGFQYSSLDSTIKNMATAYLALKKV